MHALAIFHYIHIDLKNLLQRLSVAECGVLLLYLGIQYGKVKEVSKLELEYLGGDKLSQMTIYRGIYLNTR